MTPDAVDLYHDLAVMNETVRDLGGQVLVPADAALAMLDVGDVGGLRRVVIATSDYMARLAAAVAHS